VAVFLTGLNGGANAEYLGKKVEAPRDETSAMLGLLPSPPARAGAGPPCSSACWAAGSASTPAHGFTQTLYEFSSASAGNGSGMEGLGDTWGFNESGLNPSPPAPYSVHWTSHRLAMPAGPVLPRSRSPWRAVLAAKPASPFRGHPCAPTRSPSGVVLLVMVLLLGGLVFLPAGSARAGRRALRADPVRADPRPHFSRRARWPATSIWMV